MDAVHFDELSRLGNARLPRRGLCVLAATLGLEALEVLLPFNLTRVMIRSLLQG